MVVRAEMVGGPYDGKALELVNPIDRVRLAGDGKLFDWSDVDETDTRLPVSCYHRREGGTKEGRWMYDFHGTV